MNDAIELLTRTLCDPLPEKPADAAYLYCTTGDHHPSLFGAAVELAQQSRVPRILLLEAGPISGYPGFEITRAGLEAAGTHGKAVEGVPYANTEMIHTLVESEALVRCARSRGFRAIVVISPPFHLLRAFMTAVTVALREYPELAIHSRPGTAQPWMERTTHSQGTLSAPRRQLIHEELARIETYQRKGDLASFETVLDYLRRRTP